MSTCFTCAPVDCNALVDDDLGMYSLDRVIFPFVAHCPPGKDCGQTNTIRLICCGQTIVVNIPPGATLATRQRLLQGAVDACSVAKGFCGEIGAPPPVDNPNDPNAPNTPTTGDNPHEEQQLYYSKAQRISLACENGGTYHYELQEGAFIGDTQEEADAAALAFATAQAKVHKICVNVPTICFCNGVYSSFASVAGGGVPRYTAAATNGRIPVGTEIVVSGNNIYIRGTPETPGTYQFTLNVADRTTNYWTGTVTVHVLMIGYSAAITLGFTAPNVSSTTFTAIASTDFEVGSVLRFVRKVGGINNLELGRFQVTALDTPIAGLTTIENLTATPGDGFVAGDIAYWEIISPPDIVVGDPYSFQLPVVGGSGTYSWAITAGTLPDGLSMSATGLITGTPTSSDSTDVTFSVTDAAC